MLAPFTMLAGCDDRARLPNELPPRHDRGIGHRHDNRPQWVTPMIAVLDTKALPAASIVFDAITLAAAKAGRFPTMAVFGSQPWSRRQRLGR